MIKIMPKSSYRNMVLKIVNKIIVFCCLFLALISCKANDRFSKDTESLALFFGLLQQGRVVDSGQVKCYDTNVGSGIPCNDATYPRQDADYINVPKPRSVSSPIRINHSITGESSLVTFDYGTGLVWTSCLMTGYGVADSTDGCANSGIPPVGEVTDLSTATSYCEGLNTKSYGNRRNWRLPSIRELRTLVVTQPPSPYYDTTAFPGTVNVLVWSSTPTTSGSSVYYVDFSDGSIYNSTANYVRCVSGPPLQSGRFMSLTDGIEKDTATGLMFTRCAAGQNESADCAGSPNTENWADALKYCNDLSKEGYSWRLPGIHELEILLGNSGSIDKDHFPNAGAGQYWTSTSYTGSAMNALVISFDPTASRYGNTGKSGVPPPTVRCVAGP